MFGNFLREFKAFAMRGNVIDLAVGVIIGAAFGKIVTSLVDDIVMPPLGRMLGNLNFADLYVNLSPNHYTSLAAAKQAGAATINYGLFVTNVINFGIVALAIFVVVRQINRLRGESPRQEPTTHDCPYCQMAISRKATRCPHCTSTVAAE
jgi:large conductance mechanosensitive channel